MQRKRKTLMSHGVPKGPFTLSQDHALAVRVAIAPPHRIAFMTATVPRAFQFKPDRIGPWVIGLIAVTLIAGGVLVVLRSMSAQEQVRWLIALLAVTLVLGVLAIMLALRTLKANRALLTGMQQLAREDALTGAINRRGLDDVVPVEFARARRSGQPLTFVMIDLDHFKRYNDRRGHPAGDAVLRGAAQAWLNQLRPTDILARYGGEEFTLVLPGTDAKQAEQLVDRLRAPVPDRQTFSAGIATWDGYETATEVLQRADAALLQAKKAGRNRIMISGMEPQVTLPLMVVA